jgi:hypothetical protein
MRMCEKVYVHAHAHTHFTYIHLHKQMHTAALIPASAFSSAVMASVVTTVCGTMALTRAHTSTPDVQSLVKLRMV